jgi:hypothetical protein
MADDYTLLNPGSGGDAMDEISNTFGGSPTTRKRPKVVIYGAGLDEEVAVLDTDADGTEYGLVTRPLVTKFPGTNICTLQSVGSVASSTETTVATFTVTAAKTFYFLGFVAEGDLHGIYKVYVQSTAKLASRTTPVVPTTSVGFPQAVFTAAATEVVTIKVTHYEAGKTGTFNATIIGFEL